MFELLAQIDKLTMALVGVIALLVKDGIILVKSLVTKNKVEERFHALEALMKEQTADIRVVKDGVKYPWKADEPIQKKQMEILIQLNTTLAGVQVLLQANNSRWAEIKDAMDKSEARLTDRIKEIGR